MGGKRLPFDVYRGKQLYGNRERYSIIKENFYGISSFLSKMASTDFS
jgi:hypothetical protein